MPGRSVPPALMMTAPPMVPLPLSVAPEFTVVEPVAPDWLPLMTKVPLAMTVSPL